MCKLLQLQIYNFFFTFGDCTRYFSHMAYMQRSADTLLSALPDLKSVIYISHGLMPYGIDAG